jgi:hypothetical protein
MIVFPKGEYNLERDENNKPLPFLIVDPDTKKAVKVEYVDFFEFTINKLPDLLTRTAFGITAKTMAAYIAKKYPATRTHENVIIIYMGVKKI